MSNVQAIFQKRYTEVATFTGVPSKQIRESLSRQGFVYKNGQWIKSHVEGSVLTEETLAATIAA